MCFLREQRSLSTGTTKHVVNQCLNAKFNRKSVHYSPLNLTIPTFLCWHLLLFSAVCLCACGHHSFIFLWFLQGYWRLPVRLERSAVALYMQTQRVYILFPLRSGSETLHLIGQLQNKFYGFCLGQMENEMELMYLLTHQLSWHFCACHKIARSCKGTHK